MDDINPKNSNSNAVPKHTVHVTLAHSYFWYLLPLVLAVFLDMLYPIRVFHDGWAQILGAIFLIVATFLIYWAQVSSHQLRKTESITKESFCRGPYCYTRTPTHWGIFLLVLSLGLILNAFFVMLFTLVSFLITKIFFVKKQEAILEQKYGAPYLEYKKIVKY